MPPRTCLTSFFNPLCPPDPPHPQISLICLAVHDLALLFKEVPVPKTRPLQAFMLSMVSVTIQLVMTGYLADILYFLGLPFVALSGYFEVYYAILVLPFTIGALVLWGCIKCCVCACKITKWGLGPILKRITEGFKGGAQTIADVPGLPPLVDLTSVSGARGMRAQAIWANFGRGTTSTEGGAPHAHCESGEGARGRAERMPY